MEGGELRKMGPDTLVPVGHKGGRRLHGAVEGEDFADPVLGHGISHGDLVGYLPGANLVSLHGNGSLAQHLVINLLRGDDRDDHLVAADDLPAGSLSEREDIRLRAVDLRIIHREGDRGLTLLVPLGGVVMPGCCRDEEAFRDRDVPILQRIAVVSSLAARRLVGLVEDSKIESFTILHRLTDD